MITIPKDNKQVYKKAEKSIQRGKKLDPKGIYQHFLLSQKCPILLLRCVLSIIYPQISNLFLIPLLLNNPYPLVEIGPMIIKIVFIGIPIYNEYEVKEYARNFS